MEREYFARRTAMRGVNNDFLVYRAYLWFLGLTAIAVGAMAAYRGEPLSIVGASIGGGLLACFLAHELRLAREWARVTAGVLCALFALAAVGSILWDLRADSLDGPIFDAVVFGAGAIALLNPSTARRFRAARLAIVEAASSKVNAREKRADVGAS